MNLKVSMKVCFRTPFLSDMTHHGVISSQCWEETYGLIFKGPRYRKKIIWVKTPCSLVQCYQHFG